ncbi:hypothetical protein ACFLSS_04540 [Bacteroidota bacterium]
MNRRISWIIAVFLFICVSLSAQNSTNSDITNSDGPGSYKTLNANDGSITIPFKMHNRKPLMDVEINGKRASLMIDNGVLWNEVWLFGSPLVEELDLKPVEESGLKGVGEEDPTRLYSTDNLTLKFGDIIFYEQPVLVSPPAAGFARMFPGVDGQLCNTFFKHFIVEFDFIQNEIILHNPDKFNYKGNGSILDMQLTKTGSYSVPFEFTMSDGKVYKDRANIDLGGIYSFMVALNTDDAIQPPSGAKERPSFGGTEYIAQIENMTIGDYTFEQPTVVFGDEKTFRVHPKNIGMIGLPMFMKFNIIFDYFNNKLYLEPNKDFNNSFE